MKNYRDILKLTTQSVKFVRFIFCFFNHYSKSLKRREQVDILRGLPGVKLDSQPLKSEVTGSSPKYVKSTLSLRRDCLTHMCLPYAVWSEYPTGGSRISFLNVQVKHLSKSGFVSVLQLRRAI